MLLQEACVSMFADTLRFLSLHHWLTLSLRTMAAVLVGGGGGGLALM